MMIELISEANTDCAHPTLFALYSQQLRAFIEPVFGWDEDYQRRRVAHEYLPQNTHIILADGLRAGYVVFAQKSHALHLSLLLIRTEWQRKGIGREVMSHISAVARAEAKPVTLSCFKANTVALGFYSNQGFAIHREDPYFLELIRKA